MLEKITNLDINLLTKHFYAGCKSERLIGVEYEKLPVYKENYQAVKYEDIARLLLMFKDPESLGIYSEGHIIGLKNSLGTVTLEPGSQFELSLNPLKSLSELKHEIELYNFKTHALAEKNGVCWLGYGIQPLSIYENINIIPKKRYEFMTEYLPAFGSLPLVMMRETSGIQVALDYSSPEDAISKLALSLKLSPIVSTIFANSPIRAGKLTKYKSFRAFSWLHTDENRCGLISSKLFKNNQQFTFEDYAQVLLDVPMIFIERPYSMGGCIPVRNLTFRRFLKEGYCGISATLQDWELHCSLYFPDVRLNGYLEIRNHDNQRAELITAVPAFWKAVLYNNDAFVAVTDLLSQFDYLDFEYIRHKTPACGLDLIVKKHSLKDIAKELVSIAFQSLKLTNEESFIEPIKSLIDDGLVPADIIIKNWESIWDKSLSRLIEYSAL